MERQSGHLSGHYVGNHNWKEFNQQEGSGNLDVSFPSCSIPSWPNALKTSSQSLSVPFTSAWMVPPYFVSYISYVNAIQNHHHDTVPRPEYLLRCLLKIVKSTFQLRIFGQEK